MKQIYVITTIYAEYKNNKELNVTGNKEVLYAVSSEEEAKEVIAEKTIRNLRDREDWFKNHEYGIFVKEYNIEKIALF